MKAFSIKVAVALIALSVTPVLAFSSTEISTEKGTGEAVRAYSGIHHQSWVATDVLDNVALSSEQGLTNNDVRGYFRADQGAVSVPDADDHIRQSRENGAF